MDTWKNTQPARQCENTHTHAHTAVVCSALSLLPPGGPVVCNKQQHKAMPFKSTAKIDLANKLQYTLD